MSMFSLSTKNTLKNENIVLTSIGFSDKITCVQPSMNSKYGGIAQLGAHYIW